MRDLKLRLGAGIAVAALAVASCMQAPATPTATPGGPTPTAPATSAPETSAPATPTAGPTARPSVDEIGAITIEMWQHTFPPLQGWTEARIAEFTEMHPNVTVNLQAVPFQQYQDRLFTAIAAGRAPAFYEVNEWTMAQFIDAGVIAPLDLEALGFASLDEARAAYEGSALEGAVANGMLYGSPYDWTAPVIGVYNALLEEHNIDKASLATWDGLMQAAAQMSERDANGNLTVSGFAFVHGIVNYYKHQGNSLFAQAGARIITEDKTAAAINSPEARRVFELWRDAIHVHGVTQPGFTATFYTNEMGEGRVGSGFMLPWANSILAPFGWEFGREYDILPLPHFEGGTDELASYAWYWTVNAQASEEESIATHALIKYLSENSSSMLTEAGLVLPRVGWFDSQPADVQASYATIREALLRAVPSYDYVRYNEIWEPVVTVFESVEANPDADLDALLSAAELQINGIINRP